MLIKMFEPGQQINKSELTKITNESTPHQSIFSHVSSLIIFGEGVEESQKTTAELV